MTLLFPKTVNEQTVSQVKNVFQNQKIAIVTLQQSDKRLIIRTKPLNEKEDTKLLQTISSTVSQIKQDEFETIGPVIGKETALNALKSIGIASLLIVLFIAYSFRAVPKPLSSWRFGIAAVIALIHDVLVVLGIFSLLGHFYGLRWIVCSLPLF